MELVRLVLSLPVRDDVGDLLGREDVGVDADIVGCEKSKSFLLAIPLNLPTQSLVNLELLWENPRDLLPTKSITRRWSTGARCSGLTLVFPAW